MKLRITCRQAIDFISKREEGKLSLLQHVQLWLHMGICGLCKLFAKQNKIIISALSKFEKESEHHLTAEEKKDIVNAIKDATGK